MNFKNIHIGQMIETVVAKREIELSRICNFLKCSEEDIKKMYERENIDSEVLLKWSKLLEYDFFRVYSQHLILYSPPSGIENTVNKKIGPHSFRKNIYTINLIQFILELLETGEKTKKQIVEEYKIPKTTLYKWIDKYNNKNN